MYSRGRTGTRRAVNIWPGFVDGLATLLLVVIFVLMVFVVAQYILTTVLTGKDQALTRLERQVSELADILALERAAGTEMRLNVDQLSSELQASLGKSESLAGQLAALAEERNNLERILADAESEADRLAADKDRVAADKDRLAAEKARIAAEAARVSAELEDAYKVVDADKEKIEVQLMELAILQSLRDDLYAKLKASDSASKEAQDQAKELAARLSERSQALSTEERLSEDARRKVDLLNRQIFALRQQLASLQDILDAAEAEAKDKGVQITQLTDKLNLALATKVQELKRYRSEFFGRLREVLGDQQGIRVVGDRFVFQSEVLFGSGSAEMGQEGRSQMGRLAQTLREVAAKFPKDIDWILRVDGHTDKRPIHTAEFKSNWDLSAARAISVVNYLVASGISPNRLAATGFGEFQPLDDGRDEIAYRRNRRIELKLTQR